jgi:hypothetical protein
MSKFAKRAKLTFLVVLYVTISVATAFARDGAAGDSIAFGTGHALHVATFARERMSSCWILKHEVPLAVGHFDHFAISAGVNDAPGPCLEAIINHIDAGQFVLILPPGVNSARAHIASVAAARHIQTVSYVPGRDHLHPRSYPAVAAAIRAIWKESSSPVR